jgi:hypothetical protein
MEEIMYIYKIVNTLNGKLYVGKTNNPAERKSAHFREYKNNKGNKTLYNAMIKHGASNFEFSVIEECPDDIWEERECYWIKHYNSLKDGYNMIEGGSEPPHYKNEQHPLSKLNWDMVHKIKIELCTDKPMNVIAFENNIGIDQIYRINTGESWAEGDDFFPIRNKNRLEQESLDQIIWMLQNTDITQKQIGILFNRTRTAITAINNGDNYFNKDLSYPLRKGRHYNQNK